MKKKNVDSLAGEGKTKSCPAVLGEMLSGWARLKVPSLKPSLDVLKKGCRQCQRVEDKVAKKDP